MRLSFWLVHVVARLQNLTPMGTPRLTVLTYALQTHANPCKSEYAVVASTKRIQTTMERQIAWMVAQRIPPRFVQAFAQALNGLT
jgi:hypothetical protein